MLLTWAINAGSAVVPTQEIGRALRIQGDSAQANNWADAAPVDLPDEWSQSRPRAGGGAWYRLGFEMADLSGRVGMMAIYFERLCSSAEIFLNGVLIHDSRSAAEALPRNCMRPLLLTLPASLFKSRGNFLDIRLSGYSIEQVATRRTAAGLSTVAVGTHEALVSRYEWRQAFAVTLPLIESVLFLVVGIFVATFGWVYRARSSLWYFGGLIAAWALMAARNWVADLPWPQADAELVYASPLTLVVLTGVQFFIRFAGRRHPRVDMALVAQCLLMPLSLAFAGSTRIHTLSSLWMLVLFAEIVAGCGFHLVDTWRNQPRRFKPALATVGLGFLALSFEVAAPLLPPSLSPAIAALAYALTGLLLISVGLRRVKRSGQRPTPIVTDQRDIEVRVREATAQIERNFAQIADMKVEQVTERERKRIAADLHDDLGAKLLTIVHTSDNDRISTLAREALEEMRLSVRGLTGKPVKLADAMGDWRAEVVARLSQSGIEANWSSPSDEDVPQTLSARAFVQTTRILRESVSNTIKHSGASQCSVRCLIADGDFQLVVQDNGNGIPMELDGRMDGGHGLASMKNRAKQLQGQCLMESGPGYGTVIRLTIPLDPHVEVS